MWYLKLKKSLLKRVLISKRSYSTVKSEWKSVVGLEVHAQLNTASKLFSGAQNTFGGSVNDCVSLLDAAIPGTLPVLNRRCVELAIKTALALSCNVNEVSTFDRKHYFYADLPAGYQITQQRAPLASDGVISFQVFTPGIHKKPYNKSSKIKQIQLEQDSGKSLHDSKSKESLIDLNRAGAPLIELVFEPDLEDGEEAAALVKELVLILQRVDACTCRMQEGALRVDANVSLNREGEPLSTRTEIKNIGSVRAVAGAIKHEIERQRSVLEKGGLISNETRAWDATKKITVSMRDKEVVQDYRFMPEPNLPPLRVNLKTKEDNKDVVSVKLMQDQIPELPEETRRKLIKNLDLRPDLAIRLVNEPKLLEYFQEILSKTDIANATEIALILTNDILGVFNRRKVNIEDCPLTLEQMKEAIDMVLSKEINLEIFKQVIDEYVVSPNEDISPKNLVEKRGWFLITDENVIIKECMEVLKNNPKLVKKYKNGKVKVFRTFLGMLAKNTQNTIDMSLASKKLDELLKSDKI